MEFAWQHLISVQSSAVHGRIVLNCVKITVTRRLISSKIHLVLWIECGVCFCDGLRHGICCVPSTSHQFDAPVGRTSNSPATCWDIFNPISQKCFQKVYRRNYVPLLPSLTLCEIVVYHFWYYNPVVSSELVVFHTNYYDQRSRNLTATSSKQKLTSKLVYYCSTGNYQFLYILLQFSIS